MDTKCIDFINVENSVLSLVSNKSGKIFGFNDKDDFNNYVDEIANFNPFIDNTDREVHVFETVFIKLHNESKNNDDKIREILLRLLFLYKQYRQKNALNFDKYHYNRLKYAVEGIHNKGYRLFMPIFNTSSFRVRNEVLWMLRYLNDVNNDSDKHDRDHAYRSLTTESDKIISSICSDILRDNRIDFSKVKKSKRLDKVMQSLKNNDVKKVDDISNQLKNIDGKRLKEAIKILQETELPSKGKLVKMLNNLKSLSRDKKHELNKIINIFNNIEVKLSNYRKVIKGRYYIITGIKNTCDGIKKTFKGINSMRNGFDGSHGPDTDDIDPNDYKSEAILSLNTTMAISKYLIDKFK